MERTGLGERHVRTTKMIEQTRQTSSLSFDFGSDFDLGMMVL